MRRLAAMCIMVLAVAGSVSAGSIYKCTDAAGNVTFSQTECPNKASGSKIEYSESHIPKSNNNHSPVEQLIQLESMKSKQRISNQYSGRLQIKKCRLYKKKAQHYRTSRRQRDEEQEIYWLEKIERECR